MSSSIGLSAVEKNEFNFNNCFMVMQVFEFYIKKVIEFFLKRYIQAPLFYAISSDIISDKILSTPLGSPRPPFDDLIQRLVALGNPNQNNQKSPVIVSVDIPSGWHVEEGDISGKGIKPDMLVSTYRSETFTFSLWKL